MNINNNTETKLANNSEAEESRINSNEPEENDSSLQALINEEQSLVRQRLREETGREPTQEEVDKWLSEQTEGY
jgi:hypothetical protein